MRTFDSFIRRLEAWQRKARYLRSSFWRTGNPLTWISVPTTQAIGRTRVNPRKTFDKARSPIVLALAVVLLTGIIGYRFYNQPQLAVGTVAPETVEAPLNGSFVDTRTTENRRKAIKTGTVPILKRDLDVTERVDRAINQSIDQIEQLRQLAGPFPFVETSILSSSAQQHLRSAQAGEWQMILKSIGVELQAETETLSGSFKSPTGLNSAAAQRAVTQLRAYALQASDLDFQSLIERVTQARQQYAKVEALLKEQGNLVVKTYKTTLLELSEENWQETKNSILQASQRILTQGIPPGLPQDIIERTIRLQLALETPEASESLATDLLLATLEPNLTEDKEETKRRAEQAARNLEPVIVEINQGEVIVKAGETISQADFVLLDSFGLSRRKINWLGLAGAGILVAGAVGIFRVIERFLYLRLRGRDYLLLCLLSLSAPLLPILGIKYSSLPAVGLLVSSFYSPGLAVAQVTLLSGLTAFSSLGLGLDYLLASTAGGLIAAIVAGRLRSRDELSLLGGAIGIIQGSVYLIVNLIFSSVAGAIWYVVLPGAIICGLSGVAWSVVALGISPYLERLFDLVTPIRLAELSNPNRPLLKRLATEAPGTFQHTLFVASLAEAAARELHCNVELVRAGTLYHDIGKMHDPLGFIENQMNGPNKHDEINDPWKSAGIIKKHVSEGLVLARKCGLPRAIQAFIPEHQGTLLISYFYFQAKKKAEQEEFSVSEADFRYVGPIPQSRETALVMLADACEAALRSLKDATPETVLATINKILKARWQDNQLVDSGLKYEDLPIISKVFVRVWQQFNHKRIAYPKATLEPRASKSELLRLIRD